jgi:LPXTG-motif cell wall-anchored protein
MVDLRRHAAALIAVIALGAPATALAQSPTPEPQPPISSEPPEPLGTPEATATPAPSRGTGKSDLPNTGAEAGLMALLGLGLIASGGGLRATLARGRD